MRTPILLLAAALAGSQLTVAQSPPPLTAALREGDTAALARGLAGGADPNQPDASGASPLMYAAVYGSAAEMKRLIDAGANVNHANGYGATALMWAAGDTAKVSLLVEHGAKVDARAVDRTTPLLAAARRGNADAMRLLIARGASPTAIASDTTNLLRTAYMPYNAAVSELLEAQGVRLKAADIIPPMVGFNLNDAAIVRRMIAAGANPNQRAQQVTLEMPIVAFTLSNGHSETLRVFIDAGADVRAAGTHSYTALMMAAAALRPNPASVQLLLDKGADLHARDAAGRTALDWALLQGETPVAALLRKAGARETAPPPPAPVAVATPRSAAAAVARAIAQLQPTGPVFYERTKCISCHQQSLPAMAVKLASDRGVPVDRALAPHPTTASLETWKGLREQFLLGNQGLGGFIPSTTYALLAMRHEGEAASPESDAAVLLAASMQQPDGSWRLPPGPAGVRPPLDGGSPVHVTALTIHALASYMPPSRRADASERIARGVAFLRATVPHDTQDEAFKLLGLVWGRASGAEIAAQVARLRALQRQDGGWAQLPTMKPDAYATGQALYALHESGMKPGANAYQKGADYLRRTQLEDGTWFVRSRAFGFQPYFETGFPHGRDQFISSAATSWAAIALALTL